MSTYANTHTYTYIHTQTYARTHGNKLLLYNIYDICRNFRNGPVIDRKLMYTTHKYKVNIFVSN